MVGKMLARNRTLNKPKRQMMDLELTETFMNYAHIAVPEMKKRKFSRCIVESPTQGILLLPLEIC